MHLEIYFFKVVSKPPECVSRSALFLITRGGSPSNGMYGFIFERVQPHIIPDDLASPRKRSREDAAQMDDFGFSVFP
jgi:hypothetical protein